MWYISAILCHCFRVVLYECRTVVRSVDCDMFDGMPIISIYSAIGMISLLFEDYAVLSRYMISATSFLSFKIDFFSNSSIEELILISVFYCYKLQYTNSACHNTILISHKMKTLRGSRCVTIIYFIVVRTNTGDQRKCPQTLTVSELIFLF